MVVLCLSKHHCCIGAKARIGLMLTIFGRRSKLSIPGVRLAAAVDEGFYAEVRRVMPLRLEVIFEIIDAMHFLTALATNAARASTFGPKLRVG